MNNQNEKTFEKTNRISRITACVIDLFVMTFVMISIASIALGSDFIDKYDIAYIQTILLLVIIPSLILFFSKDSFRGISAGRWIMGIMVRNESDNHVPSYIRLLIRNLFIIIWPVELIVLLVNNNKGRIGDKVTKTIVVKNPIKPKRILGIGIFIFIGICFYFFIDFYGGAIMTNSEAYEIAVDSIEKNEKILEETGDILEYDRVKGSITINNEIEKAEFEFKVIGKENDVVVNVYLEKEPNQKWIIKEMK
jgi:uncharacterized RDD family membrane protein YckC